MQEVFIFWAHSVLQMTKNVFAMPTSWTFEMSVSVSQLAEH